MSLTELLVQRNIPLTTPNRGALAAVERMSDEAVAELVQTFGVNVAPHDQLAAAKNIVNAVLIGGSNIDMGRVRTAVYKRVDEVVPVTSDAPVALPSLGPTFAMPAVKVQNEVFAIPVIPENADAEVTGRVGKRINPSAFERAVDMLEAAGTLSREAQLNLLLAADFKKSSATVYLWRYGKGERS